mmetsp:Transcript_14311/g.19573  ORF Transcript_14311/g.19573 Transcript_14311/m.19573 type:complete len:81 (-) Transcript_14311:7-249(-)
MRFILLWARPTLDMSFGGVDGRVSVPSVRVPAAAGGPSPPGCGPIHGAAGRQSILCDVLFTALFIGNQLNNQLNPRGLTS